MKNTTLNLTQRNRLSLAISATSGAMLLGLSLSGCQPVNDAGQQPVQTQPAPQQSELRKEADDVLLEDLALAEPEVHPAMEVFSQDAADVIATTPPPTPAIRPISKPKIAKQNVAERKAQYAQKMERHQSLMVMPAAGAAVVDALGVAPHYPQDRENYATLSDNPLKLVAEHPVSTFSIDVDTGSYSNVRRFLNQGQLPRQDAVRVEELINYFNYDYAGPENPDQPFAFHTEMAPSPWNADSVLLHVGIKGYDIPAKDLPPANLVFLLDVSGSMNSANKLGLLKQGFRLLTNQLRQQDTVSIVVYAGASGTVLEPTSGSEKAEILRAIEQLNAGGSTNGAAGIELAYQLAEANKKPEGINRVILATDGDFNVGTVNFEALKDMVERRRETGISLTTLGFGTGNYNDHLMEQLADNGNGNYAYIDNLQEARKVLVEELGSTLQTIAKDVKIQIEFNPQQVASYRLVGYENRMLKREDFNNDKVDAGDIGAGHTVTAIYELELAGDGKRLIDPLRYGSRESDSPINSSDELAFLKLRYKLPAESKSKLLNRPLYRKEILSDVSMTSDNFRFAAAVAGFGQLLRGGTYTGNMDYDQIVDLSVKSKGSDPWGYRSEFVNLVRLADQLAK